MRQMCRQEVNIARVADWIDKGTVPHEVFNKFKLKTMQKAILNCLQVSDVVANLPTGFGKSLLFQYPASLQRVNATCILVIVPLKALLWDTIREARQLGIIAEQIDRDVIRSYYTNDQLPQMLLATPEKIFAAQDTFHFIESLQADKKIKLLVIDQCHCISEWGHDFRPAYLQLQKLREALSGVRLLAISATITPETRIDLSRRLFLHSANYFQASYHRSNLFYGVIKCKDKGEFKNSILSYLREKKMEDSFGIIYCQTITAAESLSNQLKQADLKAGVFHSKLSENLRKQTYDKFMEGKIKIIVGTICFGMGINKKDIRFVINVGVSKSPENYYQQSGRAGRDGEQAHCIIISFPTQINSISFLIGKGTGNNKQKSHQLIKLQQIDQYCQEQNECRRTCLFRKLGQNFKPQDCGKKCDNCAQDEQKNIKLVDFYKEAKKILEELQATKNLFTKKQLCDYLKGKCVNSNKRGKKLELKLGEDIKGIFGKEKMEVIEKIVDTMISKQLIIRHLQNLKNKYVVNYFKAANKNSTRSFHEFLVTISEEKSLKKVEKTDKPDKSNKFDRFLKLKGASQLKTVSKVESLEQLAPRKSQCELLIEADVVKAKQDYQSFFIDLYGSQLYSDLEIKTSGSQILSEADEEEPIQIVEQYEDEKVEIESLAKIEQSLNSTERKTKEDNQPLLPQKRQTANLKRNQVDTRKFQQENN